MAGEPKKIVRIEVEDEDGRVTWATGDDAEKIWAYMNSALFHMANHGSRFNGPFLQPKPPEAR